MGAQQGWDCSDRLLSLRLCTFGAQDAAWKWICCFKNCSLNCSRNMAADVLTLLNLDAATSALSALFRLDRSIQAGDGSVMRMHECTCCRTVIMPMIQTADTTRLALQIFIPEVNWMLAALTVLVVIGFQTSVDLGNA